MRKPIKNKLKFTIICIFAMILMTLSFVLGMKFSWTKQLVMYEVLRQTSILIFGLIGAWFAVLLPFSIEKKEHTQHFFSFSRKLFPALSAAIYLLIITLLIPFCASIIKEYCVFTEFTIHILRGLSMSIISFGVAMMFYGLLMILASFDVLKKDIEFKENGESLENNLKPSKTKFKK